MNERDGSRDWSCPKPMTAYAKPPEIPINRYGETGWIAEPKVDGIRITLRRRDGGVLAWTRPGPGRPNGRIRPLPQLVIDAVSRLPNGVYDGELAVAGRASWDAASDDQDDEKSFFAFDVLEIVNDPVVRRPWKERRQILEMAVSPLVNDRLVLVPVVAAHEVEYDKVLEAGGEGLMLKKPSSVYRPGARTKEWLKVKPTERAPFTIDGYEPAIRGPHATLVLRDLEPARNRITVGTPSQIMAVADKDPTLLLGRPIIVKYQIRTPSGSYRHPRVDREKTFAAWGVR